MREWLAAWRLGLTVMARLGEVAGGMWEEEAVLWGLVQYRELGATRNAWLSKSCTCTSHREGGEKCTLSKTLP